VHRIGKKIGTFTKLFPPTSLISKILLRTVLGEEMQAGSTDLTKEDLKELGGVDPSSGLNAITIHPKNDQLLIQFGHFVKSKTDAKIGGVIATKATFAVDLKTLDVYNSEY
jgi:hypothetical protein